MIHKDVAKGRHLDQGQLFRLLELTLSPEEMVWAQAHLLVCDRCRERLTALSAPPAPLRQAGSDRQDAGYGPAIQRARSLLVRRAGELEQESRRAPSLLQELLEHPPAARRELIKKARFRSRSLAEALLDHCRGAWSDDPAAAELSAQLAMDVIDRLDEERFGSASLNDLRAQGWAYLANLRRIRSDLRGVEQAFRTAESYLTEGSGDPLARAEILDLKASHLRAQRRFDEALRLLNQVAAAYGKAKDDHLVGRTLVSKAMIHSYAGRPERSLRLLEKAARRIDRERDPRLEYVTQHQRALCLNECGHPEAALELIPQLRELAACVGTRHDRLRVVWLEGKIAISLGHLEEGEELLTRVQRAFCELEMGYDAALASLELAALYLRQGRAAETKGLITEMLPIFRSRDIHREALATLMVFKRAVEIETVTLGMVEDISQCLRRTREVSGLRQEKPS